MSEGVVLFGEKLKRARQAKDLSQDRLGQLLGITGKAVSAWERGENNPELDKMEAISRVLDVSLSDLMEKGPQRQPAGAEGHQVELAELPAAIRGPMSAAIGSLKRAEVWQLTTDAISGAGYQRDRYVSVDVGAYAPAGSLVLAIAAGRPVFRLYYPPYLFRVSASGGSGSPELVDNNRVSVRGPIVF